MVSYHKTAEKERQKEKNSPTAIPRLTEQAR